ncbi:hypothetical protein BATDEDRAFT_37041 [Batrachochytrium dendrobatidis JAM81]|uniref:SAP domain-containing protein n=1 Tax=Batrachochytrium dendrobatidis (strain JAM81 / FGSC 10211) TaxID=684364 RepID=F4P479_BATDJ|nr:uncharacterized protein BATDEDRAFT_37041 [Batrachochytrium dendrobatidis JAM81]EGF79950.1 hypothetical protein BATDEDRAFT_37041 [Batrachochytrium dendrobatidis JAM81]KAJ8323258.1 hypothetical protein O5D80_008022 [Batrachochytrium dendrobatidis]KAK5672966.1 hypothetical protein QVD99_000446 [Batrachochytrium dendrobatidis]|eukprot:XP_006679602.1 hypothetical protein BATDEDRAFT_37041 [Batrachochytrium dendrobatidis JAM81]
MDTSNGNIVTADSTDVWTVKKLQDELRKRKLATDGTRHELVKRLESATLDDTQDPQPGSVPLSRVRSKRSQRSKQASRVTIWNSPALILTHFILYLGDVVADTACMVANHFHIFFTALAVVGLGFLVYTLDGEHQEMIGYIESLAVWYGWWIGLGITSSIGLGTGLHTFMLFLAPFIAQATFAAYSCRSLDFTTRGPNSFVCDPVSESSADPITVWTIASKVHMESLLWGLGTAIGELPPYFVARAAAVAGQNDPEFASIERILAKPIQLRNWSERTQIVMHSIVTNMGFFGILLCASVPNPLFDLAGIICGHFAVPFSTFFGATMIGKSFIKSSIQSFAVIVVFSEDVQKSLLVALRKHAPYLHAPFKDFFESQERKFRNRGGQPPQNASIISLLWNAFMVFMILYFVISIVESLALSSIERRKAERITKKE